ncbi:hypothetical protein D3C85_1600100 [compost metagenome]
MFRGKSAGRGMAALRGGDAGSVAVGVGGGGDALDTGVLGVFYCASLGNQYG